MYLRLGRYKYSAHTTLLGLCYSKEEAERYNRWEEIKVEVIQKASSKFWGTLVAKMDSDDTKRIILPIEIPDDFLQYK